MVKTLVLGIGQRFRCDDGAGIVAVQRWRSMFPVHDDIDVIVELLELPGLKLLDYLVMADFVLVVDAVQSGAPSGSILWLSEVDVSSFEAGNDLAHGWGVGEVLAISRQVQPDKMPVRLDILGIEVEYIGMGEGLSTPVSGAIDNVVMQIETWVQDSQMKIGNN